MVLRSQFVFRSALKCAVLLGLVFVLFSGTMQLAASESFESFGLGSAPVLENADYWISLGLELAKAGRLQEAIECFNKALEINPRESVAWFNKGRALGELGRYDKAIECYDAALKINERLVEAWINKGVALDDLGRYDEAIVCYAEALDIQPREAMAWYNKGIALRNLGRYTEAIECYDNALSSYPYFADAWKNKGFALAALSRDDEAAESNEKVDLLESTCSYSPLPPGRTIASSTAKVAVKEGPSGPDGQAFYNVSSYPEVNESYSFFKQYYDLDLQLESLVEEGNGTSYLVGIFRNNTTEVRFETFGGFFMPAYRPEMRGKEVVAFDCSEISALTEYYLERAGIPAKIAITGNLTNVSGKMVASTRMARPESNFTHAFVLLDLSGGPYYIDPSRPDFNRSAKLMLIGPGDPEYGKPYYDYERVYENIYALIKESHSDPKGWLLDQFDWWNSAFFREEGESDPSQALISS